MNDKAVLYTPNIDRFNEYYTKSILQRLLSRDTNVIAIYSDKMPSDYVKGISVFPIEMFRNNFRENIDADIYICETNPVYAEEKREELQSCGYHHVHLPNSIGMDCSRSKFNTIEFNLNIGCSLNCLYCPQKKIVNSYLSTVKDKSKVHWSFQDFCYVISNRMNPASTIGFSGMSEPFENPEAVEMICYAYQTGHPIMLNTTLMGLSLSGFNKLQSEVKRFERIFLHVPDEELTSHFNITEEYKIILKLFIESYKKYIEFFSSHGKVNDEVLEMVSEYNIPINDKPELYFSDRAGNLEGIKTRVSPPRGQFKKIVCSSAGASHIHALTAMPDGRLALCCNDYSPRWDIGNIIEESWETVSRSEGIKKFVCGLDFDNDSACWKCTSAIERNAAIRDKYPDWYIHGDNFLRIRNAIEDDKENPVIKKLQEATHICIYGLGKFFKDSYFASYWSTIIQADILSDGNKALYGKKIMGIPVVPKENLIKYENLLVIIYVQNDKEIREDLYRMDVKNVINILEVMKMDESI